MLGVDRQGVRQRDGHNDLLFAFVGRVEGGCGERAQALHGSTYVLIEDGEGCTGHVLEYGVGEDAAQVELTSRQHLRLTQ